MNRWYYLLFLLPVGYLASCPTCMGRLSTKTPTPFFSDEHYAPYTQLPAGAPAEPQQDTADNADDEEHPDNTEDLLP